MPKCDFSLKLQSNFIEIALRYGCSPVNLLHIFRAPFLKNTSGGLLLKILHYTKKLLLKNPFFMFLTKFIFAVSQSKTYPAVHVNTSKALTSL